MKRSQIEKRESPKHRAYREELSRARDQVIRNARGVCERCGDLPIRVIHHRIRRSQGGTNDLSNLAGLCLHCHDEIHANPEQAYRDGWLHKRLTGLGKDVSNVGTD